MSPARLLLTRPRPQSERFAQDLRHALPGLQVTIAPLMDIALLPPQPDVADQAGGLIFTSLNGVRGFVQGCARRDLPVWCVGARTASEARGAGFAQVHTAEGDAPALLSMLTGNGPGSARGVAGPLLHLCGAHVAAQIARQLGKAGMQAGAQVVYDQRAVPLSAAAADLLAVPGPVVAPVFSPRSARLFVDAVAALPFCGAELHLPAISAAAAMPLAGLGNADVSIAERPDAPTMRQLVLRTIRALEAMDKPR